jgi:hypothetical protein
MDPDADPDPAVFVSDLQDVNKKYFFISQSFFAYYFLKVDLVHLHHFSKDKKSISHKTVVINVFLTIFAL